MRGHEYSCFLTREETSDLFLHLAEGLELVAVSRGNVHRFVSHDDRDVFLHPDTWMIHLRQSTGAGPDVILAEIGRCRYSGFLIFDMPREDHSYLDPCCVRYDDSMLDPGYPPAKPLFDMFKKRMTKLVGARRLTWKASGRRAFPYSEAVEAKVRGGARLILPTGLPEGQVESPFIFPD